METKLVSLVPFYAFIIYLLFLGLLENLAAPSLLRNVSHTSKSDPHFLCAHLAPRWGHYQGQKVSKKPKHCLHKQDNHQYQNDWPKVMFLSRIHNGTFKLLNHDNISLSILYWKPLAVQLVKLSLLQHLLSYVAILFSKCKLKWLWVKLSHAILDSA